MFFLLLDDVLNLLSLSHIRKSPCGSILNLNLPNRHNSLVRTLSMMSFGGGRLVLVFLNMCNALMFLSVTSKH